MTKQKKSEILETTEQSDKTLTVSVAELDAAEKENAHKLLNDISHFTEMLITSFVTKSKILDGDTPRLLFTIPKVAKMLGTTPETVRNLTKSGQLIPIKVGELKFSLEEIERFIRDGQGVDYSDPENPKPVALKEV